MFDMLVSEICDAALHGQQTDTRDLRDYRILQDIAGEIIETAGSYDGGHPYITHEDLIMKCWNMRGIIAGMYSMSEDDPAATSCVQSNGLTLTVILLVVGVVGVAGGEG